MLQLPEPATGDEASHLLKWAVAPRPGQGPSAATRPAVMYMSCIALGFGQSISQGYGSDDLGLTLLVNCVRRPSDVQFLEDLLLDCLVSQCPHGESCLPACSLSVWPANFGAIPPPHNLEFGAMQVNV